MPNALMFYREVTPPEEIAHLVLSFWEFAVKSESCEPIIHEIFPDGCISILYYRHQNFVVNTLFINALTLEIFKTEVYAGDVFWGMRLSPAACAHVLRLNPAEVQPESINDSEKFAHLTEGLLEKLVACRNFEEAIKIYETQIKTLELAPRDVDGKVAEAVRIIEENSGELKISEIAKILRLSARQLERRFGKSAGLTPKQFVRARRIRAAAVSLVEETEMNWANRAAAMGFADQAHLTHEFSTLTGRSPNSFAERVKKIEYGKLVK
jgi:AraC-like DNA-binding protein